jgi:uncharacterized protein
MNIIITGGTGELGSSLSIEFLKLGHTVFSLARSVEKIQKLEERVKNLGLAKKFHLIKCDLTEEMGVENCFNEIARICHNVDVLINNAHVTIKKGLLEISAEEWFGSIATGLNAAFFSTKFATNHFFAKQGHGHIINIGSLSTKIELERGISYSASKHALNGFSTSLVSELHKIGIKVCTLHLGAFSADANSSWKISVHEIFKAINYVTETEKNSFVQEIILRPIDWPQ